MDQSFWLKTVSRFDVTRLSISAEVAGSLAEFQIDGRDIVITLPSPAEKETHDGAMRLKSWRPVDGGKTNAILALLEQSTVPLADQL